MSKRLPDEKVDQFAVIPGAKMASVKPYVNYINMASLDTLGYSQPVCKSRTIYGESRTICNLNGMEAL